MKIMNIITDPDNPRRWFYLYQANKPVSWCERFWSCEQDGKQLAVAHDKKTQRLWKRFSPVEKFWVSARRKDFGVDWTWLSDSLLPCNANHGFLCTRNNLESNPYGRMTVTGKTYDVAGGAQKLEYSMCASPGKETQNRDYQTWYEAMNTCADRQPPSRLAVYDELVKYHDHNELLFFTRSYWVGLYFRPWIWIEKEQDHVNYKPVYYSSWGNNEQSKPNDDNCLAINGSGNAKWFSLPCSEKLNNFLCESYLEMKLLTTKSEPPVYTFEYSTPLDNQIFNKTEGISAFSEKTAASLETTRTGLPNVKFNTSNGFGAKALKNDVFTEITPRRSDLHTTIIVASLGSCLLIIGCVIGVLVWCFKCKTNNDSKAKSNDDQPDDILESLPPVSLSSEDSEYSSIRDSNLYKTLKKLEPTLPPRNQTYNQAFEDTRLTLGLSGTESMIESDDNKYLELLDNCESTPEHTMLHCITEGGIELKETVFDESCSRVVQEKLDLYTAGEPGVMRHGLVYWNHNDKD